MGREIHTLYLSRIEKMDTKNQKERSRNMSLIRSKNTGPEMFIRKKLFSMGYRYRTCVKSLPGTPDLFFKKYNAVVMVNGCFWHGHANCLKSSLPSTNRGFWIDKIEKNKKRDAQVIGQLLSLGLRIAVVWTCMLTNKSKREKTVDILNAWLRSDESFIEIPKTAI